MLSKDDLHAEYASVTVVDLNEDEMNLLSKVALEKPPDWKVDIMGSPLGPR